jgi:hypothetical protein
VEERRFAFVRRHVRLVYVDPLAGVADWQVITAPDGGTRGVEVVIVDASNAASASREFANEPGAFDDVRGRAIAPRSVFVFRSRTQHA